MLRVQVPCANLAFLRGFLFIPWLETDAYLMLMALVVDFWRQIGARHVEVNLTQGAGIGEGAACDATAVAEEGGAAVGGIRHEDERVCFVGRVFYVSV